METAAVELELDEIQGNILVGFNKDFAAFLLFVLPAHPARARAWLADVLPDVATGRQVKVFNDLFRSIRRANSTPALALAWSW